MDVNLSLSLQGLLTAVGLGLMIGVVRERLHDKEGATIAGVRTHTLVAVVTAVASSFGSAVLVTALLLVGGLAIVSYLRTAEKDPGLTGEVALMATALLSAFAQRNATLAAGLGVLVAALLYAKRPLRHFVREVISEREMQDVLLLAGAALIILPILPATPVDPWGVLVPSRLWRLVVLVMGVGMLGHVALRTVGVRWGYPLAGFFSGFVSSTAAVAGFGHRVKSTPAQLQQAVAAALLANLASLLLFAGVVGATSPRLLWEFAWPLAAAGLVLTAGGFLGLARHPSSNSMPDEPPSRAFRLSHALLLAALIASLLLLSAWLQTLFGAAGALTAAIAVALAELHAAAASIAQLFAAGGLSLRSARLGLVGLLAASAMAKTIVAWIGGGRAYGLRVGLGLFARAGAAAATALVLRG
jgi:uncharacterized membrane protein (DUF4010 family)